MGAIRAKVSEWLRRISVQARQLYFWRAVMCNLCVGGVSKKLECMLLLFFFVIEDSQC
jgi:hypothetical protein